MSHHLDSPLARQDPRLDISDVYLFRGSGGTVFVINVNPVSGEGGFHPEGMYEFKVDTDGDTVEDITFRAAFGAQDPDGRQPMELRRLDGDDARRRDSAGVVVAGGHTDETVLGDDGLRLWAGAAADPFYIEGSVVGAVVEAVAHGAPPDPGAVAPRGAVNLFAGTNVRSIVLEVPDASFDTPVIGFWGVSVLATDAGGWRQVNRCGMPLVNTIFHPADSEDANRYNLTQPSDDLLVHGPRITGRIARVVGAMGTANDPKEYARWACSAILPDVLRYEVGTPANFGFAKVNGRGLAECAPEVMFSLVLNKAVPLGLDSGSAGGPLRHGFPYLAAPLAAPA